MPPTTKTKKWRTVRRRDHFFRSLTSSVVVDNGASVIRSIGGRHSFMHEGPLLIDTFPIAQSHMAVRRLIG